MCFGRSGAGLGRGSHLATTGSDARNRTSEPHRLSPLIVFLGRSGCPPKGTTVNRLDGGQERAHRRADPWVAPPPRSVVAPFDRHGHLCLCLSPSSVVRKIVARIGKGVWLGAFVPPIDAGNRLIEIDSGRISGLVFLARMEGERS
jgi:hypothetical protein